LLERRLQLILSQEIIEEYLGIFADILDMDDEIIEKWRGRLEKDNRSTVVGLARRYTASRDPDDNLFLATANAGQAKYLVSNDRDLLDLPLDFQSKLPFEIMTPSKFIRELEGS